MKWRDITSYSQGQEDRVPEVLELKVGKFFLRVHRHIHYPPTVWLASCDGLFNCKGLKSYTPGGAKLEAIEMLKIVLVDALNAVAVAEGTSSSTKPSE